MIDPLVATWCLTAPDQIAAPKLVVLPTGAAAVRAAVRGSPWPLTAPSPMPLVSVQI
jgi:hypothetical protein